MADYLDAEAEESSEAEEETGHEEAGKKRKRAARVSDDSDEEEEEDDEARLREELKDLINDDTTDESDAEETENGKDGVERKRSRSATFDDRLEDDDYDLIEENLGITVERKKRFKRLRRIEDRDSDEEREREPEDERDAIATKLFDASGDEEEERRSTVSARPQPETFSSGESEDSQVSDPDDFIVDDDGRPITDKRRGKKTVYGDVALQEAREIFGVDFDYDELDKHAGQRIGDEEVDEEEEEDDEEVDDDVEGESDEAGEGKRRRSKKARRSKKKGKSIFEIYEPSELKRGHLTDLDNEIRNTDIPERMQLRTVPVQPVAEGSDELVLEASWIYKYAFCRPSLSIQDAHLSDEAKERARKGPRTISKIQKALDFMRNQNFEVPFIAFYRKEYVNPELNINDLWKVYKWDSKWCELRDRRNNLTALIEKTRSYQLDEIMKNPDAPLPENIRVIKEEDVERPKVAETTEELNDVYRHFILHHGHEVPKMQAEVRLRNQLAESLTGKRATEDSLGFDLEEDSENPGIRSDADALKPAPRTGTYEILRRAGLESFARRFGLTPEQYAENLRDNYQRHEIEQEPMDLQTIAEEYRGEKFSTSSEVVRAVRMMVAIQLAREPLLRKCVRETYMERAKITVRPTSLGLKTIDENHPIYSLKYLKDKPINRLVGDEFLRLSIAEGEKLVTITLSDSIEGTTSGDYLAEMKQLYHRDEFSKTVGDWNNLRGESIEIAFERILLPELKKELRLILTEEAKEFVVRSCSRKMYNWIKVAPYVCSFDEAANKPCNNVDDDEEDWETEEDKEKSAVKKWEDEEEWNTSKGTRVMGLAYVPDLSQAAFAALVTPNGECIDHLRLSHVLERKKLAREETTNPRKAADLLAIRNFISTRKPHVIVIGGESREATMLRDDLRQCISELVLENDFPKIPVEICDNELAKIYGNGNRGAEEFPSYPILLRQAVSLARRLQDPLVEFSQLCGPEDEILCLNYHPYQKEVSREELLEGIELEFVNRTNEVGVDLNGAMRLENAANLVQFVCGLGSRKAQALMKLLRRSNRRIENRTQLVTLCHMGPKVFINCAGFIKIDTASLGDSTDTYVEVLDGTRVHPETYEWARKMAVDALEYDEEDGNDANPADALQEIFQTPERLKDLDLDAFAEELERQGFGDKCVTLYDIRAELNRGYKDLRAPYEPPTPEKLFNILTKETPESFYIGKIVLATVCSFNRRKPEGEQLDGANPVRNDQTGLWQCPFCAKNDFPELSEVWNHFDAGNCPGKAIGIRLRLDNGLSGYIRLKNLSDKHVADPEERVHVGQVIHCRVIKIEVDRFSVECSSKGSDLADANNEWRPQKDLYYDTEAEEREKRREEEARRTKRQAYSKRVIVHSAFHNVSYTGAAKLLEPMKQGEAIVRPSSKGHDRLTVTWKVTDDVLHHIDVREDGKKFAFSLGNRLFIGNEEFEDLDEIIARHVNPMAAYASELLECHYYRSNVDGLEEKADAIMKEEKKENPGRIPCILSASKKYPGKFLLSYLPRERCVHEYVSVSPEGVRYRGRTFARVGELFGWFRKHFRDPRPVPEVKASSNTAGIVPGASDPTYQYPFRTPGTVAGSQYGGSQVTTPYTPSAKTPFMTPFGDNSFEKTPRYSQSTPGDGNFVYPGTPMSAASWNRRSMPASDSRSFSGTEDWQRNRHGSRASSGHQDNSGATWRGRGRGRGGDRGGRGRGGRGGWGGGSSDSVSVSSGSCFTGARSGNSTPLWDESESWDEPASTQSACLVTSDAPLWDESESWDEPEANVGNGTQVSSLAVSAASTPQIGNRSPLWDESESWDEPEANQPTETTISSFDKPQPSAPKLDNRLSGSWDASRDWDKPESAGARNHRSPKNFPPPRSTLGSNPRNGTRNSSCAKSPSITPRIGNRSPLWDESEDWDEPEPGTSANRVGSNVVGPRPQFDAVLPNETINPSFVKPRPATSQIGNRSPLWDESEDWDQPEPGTTVNQRGESNIAPPSSQSDEVPPSETINSSMAKARGSISQIGDRSPLWDESEDWDNPVSETTSLSQAAATPSVSTLGDRSPLWDESESWDNPESAASVTNQRAEASNYLPPKQKFDSYHGDESDSASAKRQFDRHRGRGGNFESSRENLPSYRGRGQSSEVYRGRRGNSDSYRARPRNFDSYRGRGGHFDSCQGRGGNSDSYRGRGGNSDSYRGRRGNSDSYRGRGGNSDSYRGRGGNSDSYRGKGGNSDSSRGKFGSYRGRGENSDSPRGAYGNRGNRSSDSYGGSRTYDLPRAYDPPSGSRTPLYAPSESWDEAESAAVSPVSADPRQAGDPSRVYAPSGTRNEPEPPAPIIPKINVDRSPLYDESESWD